MKYIIVLGILLIGYIIFSEFRNRSQIRKIDAILKEDSVITNKINLKIKRLDSTDLVLMDHDSVLASGIKKKKIAINETKKKIEDNSGNMPFLPEF